MVIGKKEIQRLSIIPVLRSSMTRVITPGAPCSPRCPWLPSGPVSPRGPTAPWDPRFPRLPIPPGRPRLPWIPVGKKVEFH